MGIETKILGIIFVIGDALIEPGEDPEVIRAKYFIRDEFLVNSSYLSVWMNEI